MQHLHPKPDKSIATIDSATIGVQLRVRDSGQPPITEDFELQLQTTSVDSPWKNQASKFDVNADNTTSPLDVLLVINYLNGGGNTALTASTNPGSERQFCPRVYLDSTSPEAFI